MSDLKMWENPLIPIEERLELCDGAVTFRDNIISNLRTRNAELEAMLRPGDLSWVAELDLLRREKEGLEAENARLREDVHNLNWALGAPGYETMATPEQQAEADAAHRVALQNIEALTQRKSKLDELQTKLRAVEVYAAGLREAATSLYEAASGFQLRGPSHQPMNKVAEAMDTVHKALQSTPPDLSEVEAMMKDAERWQKIELLMFLGDVELTQTEDGGYLIHVEPAENIMGQSWEGNSPDEAIDSAIAAMNGGEGK